MPPRPYDSVKRLTRGKSNFSKIETVEQLKDIFKKRLLRGYFEYIQEKIMVWQVQCDSAIKRECSG